LGSIWGCFHGKWAKLEGFSFVGPGNGGTGVGAGDRLQNKSKKLLVSRRHGRIVEGGTGNRARECQFKSQIDGMKSRLCGGILRA
jgi:hypothetical protein